MPLFCREFNARTSNQETGKPVMVRVEVFEDKSFGFEVRGTPTSILLKNLLKDRSEKVISESELGDLIALKGRDMNTENSESVKKIILGSMLSAGIVIRK